LTAGTSDAKEATTMLPTGSRNDSTTILEVTLIAIGVIVATVYALGRRYKRGNK